MTCPLNGLSLTGLCSQGAVRDASSILCCVGKNRIVRPVYEFQNRCFVSLSGDVFEVLGLATWPTGDDLGQIHGAAWVNPHKDSIHSGSAGTANLIQWRMHAA